MNQEQEEGLAYKEKEEVHELCKKKKKKDSV